VKGYKINIINMIYECYFFIVFIIRGGRVDGRILLRRSGSE
jgi:hypothetical protein